MLAGVTAKERIVLDGTADADLFADVPASPRGWEPDEDATASINYTSGTTARPKGVQMTHRNCWLNAVSFGWHATVTDRDTYLHTLPMFHCNGWGMPYAVTAMGVKQVVLRKVDGEDILGRIEARGRHAAVRRAGGRRRDSRRRHDAPRCGQASAREGDSPNGGRGRAAAVEDDRTRRGGAGVGVHPDLRAHRDVAAAHDEPLAGPSGTSCRPRSAPGCCRAPASPRSA